MWYKTAKTGYIDVDKELEEQLGYALPVSVYEYLKYLIVNSSNKGKSFYVVDFDKLNGYLMYSPLNHFISKFAPIATYEELMSKDSELTTFGSYNIETKEVQFVPLWNESLLQTVLDILIHEFAHAFDKGLKYSNREQPYSLDALVDLIKTFVDYSKPKLIDKNLKVIADSDKIWELYIDFIISLKPPPPGINRNDIKKMMIAERPSIVKYTLFFLSNAYKGEDVAESLKDALHTEYLNSRSELPAQLTSVKLATEPKRVFEYIKQNYMEKNFAEIPDFYERFNIPESIPRDQVFDYMNKTYSRFFNPKLRENFIKIGKEIMIDDPEPELYSDGTYEFVTRLRSKHAKRQLYKILHDNFKEFEKMIMSV